MIKKHIVVFAASVLLFGSCQKEPITNEDPNTENSVSNNGLGKKLENPYALPNMKKAVKLLMSIDPEATNLTPEDLESTHLYVRFLPENQDELDILESDSTLVYNTVPFGHENTPELEYYHDPSIPEDRITWLYAFVPVDYTFPDVRHEILEKIYRPSDEDDELDVLALKLTGNLKNEVVEEREIMAADLSDKEVLWLFGRRFNPSGRIYVENSFGGAVPLRRAGIYTKTFWWTDRVHTNDEGYYFVNRRYKYVPTVYIANRNNTNKTTQRWTEHIGILVSDKLGAGKNFHYTIRHTNGPDRDLWVKATINNAFVIYDDFANENRIRRPNEVRTWVLAGSDYGGAPLLHKQLLTSYSIYYPGIASGNSENFGSLLAKTGIYALGPIMDFIVHAGVGHHNLPDIVVGTHNQKTSNIYATVFHEMAHYSHKKGRIDNAYWANVQYQAMFDKTLGTYGDGTPTYAKYTGVAEAWSNFIEYQLMEQNKLITMTQTGPRTKELYSTNMTAYYHDPATTPASNGDAAGYARWIPSGLFRDLMDVDNNTISLKNGQNYRGVPVRTGADQVSGFTYKQIYDLLTKDVKSIYDLKAKIISRYPDKNRNNEITKLFELYGY